MPRQARVVIPGLPHHITQWGNDREDVFFTEGDRVAYAGLLREQCEKHWVRVLGYCLLIPGSNCKKRFTDGDDQEPPAALHINTQTGRPLASDPFLCKLGRKLSRRLRPLPVGRPKKEKSKTRKGLK